MGVDRDNVVMVDRRGVIHTRRDDLSPYKREFATRRDISSLDESLRGADVFIGVSKAGLLHPDMIRGMAPQPLIMALANPEPEIGMEEALAARPDAIYASGRSDLPNQVNNLLAFPYVFRGALDVRARRIDTPMKIAAAETLARLARHTPTQDEHRSGCEPAFCRERLLPTPFDGRLRHAVPHAGRRKIGRRKGRLRTGTNGRSRITGRRREPLANPYPPSRPPAGGGLSLSYAEQSPGAILRRMPHHRHGAHLRHDGV